MTVQYMLLLAVDLADPRLWAAAALVVVALVGIALFVSRPRGPEAAAERGAEAPHVEAPDDADSMHTPGTAPVQPPPVPIAEDHVTLGAGTSPVPTPPPLPATAEVPTPPPLPATAEVPPTLVPPPLPQTSEQVPTPPPYRPRHSWPAAAATAAVFDRTTRDEASKIADTWRELAAEHGAADEVGPVGLHLGWLDDHDREQAEADRLAAEQAAAEQAAREQAEAERLAAEQAAAEQAAREQAEAERLAAEQAAAEQAARKQAAREQAEAELPAPVAAVAVPVAVTPPVDAGQQQADRKEAQRAERARRKAERDQQRQERARRKAERAEQRAAARLERSQQRAEQDALRAAERQQRAEQRAADKAAAKAAPAAVQLDLPVELPAPVVEQAGPTAKDAERERRLLDKAAAAAAREAAAAARRLERAAEREQRTEQDQEDKPARSRWSLKRAPKDDTVDLAASGPEVDHTAYDLPEPVPPREAVTAGR